MNDKENKFPLSSPRPDVAKSMELDESLRRCEKELQAVKDVADCSFDWIWQIDSQGLITYVSPMVERVGGYTPEEVVGRHYSELFYPDDRERLEREAQALFVKKQPFRGFISKWIHKDGRPVWLCTCGSPILDEKGNLLGYRGSNTDITGRIKTEDALRQSQEKWEALLQNLPDVVVIVSRDGTILEINEAARSIKDAVGRNAFEYVPPEQSEVMRKAFEQVFQTGKPCSYEIQGTGPAGPNTSWYTTRLVPIEREGQVIAAAMISRDITNRKRTEEALRESEERYRLLFENSPVSIGLGSPEGAVISANKAMLDMTGYSVEEVPKVNLNDVYESVEDRRELLEQVKKYGSVSNFPTRIKRKDGTVIDVLLSASAVHVGDKRLLQSTLIDITEQKKIREELERRERLFKDVAECSSDWIWEVDDKGKVTYASPAVERVLGYRPDEALGRPFYGFVNPEDWERSKVTATDVIVQKQPFRETVGRMIHKNGQTVWVSISGSPVLDGKGNLLGYRGSTTNVTDRKLAEEALRESEERWRALVQNIPDIIITVASDGTILAINRSVIGVPVEEVVGKKVYDYIPPDQWDVMRSSLERVFRTEKKDTYEILGNGPRGPKTAWYETRAVPIKSDGEVTAVTLISTDITERRRARESLRESEEKFRLAFENAKDAILWADPETGVLINCNRAAEILFERKREDIVGQHQTAIHPPEKAKLYATMFKEHIEKRGVVDDEAEVLTASGKVVPVHITASMTSVGGRGVLQGIFRDITFRKQAEEQLKDYSHNLERMVEERTRELDRARARLFQSSKLAALGRMGAGIAHQLNSPICSGLLSVDSLTQDYKNVPKQQRVLKNLRQSLTGMHEVVECMLSMSMVSRPGVPARANVDLNQVLKRVLELSERECKKHHIKMETLFDPDLPPIEAAVGELDQVFVNLVNNAVDAMEEGGKLTVHTVKLPEGIEIHIRDTGKGIPPEHLEQIFEPFFTTRLAERGIGLGLAVAREIVERYGGEIGVVSRPRKGSTFSVRLPAVRAKAKRAGPPSQRPKQKPRR